MQRQDAPLILLTRPVEASARFAARLKAVCPAAEVRISPLQAVRFVDWALPGPPPDALIFTSQNAVAAAVRAGLTGRAYCVGNQTAEAAAAAGFSALSAEGAAGDLLALIVQDAPRHLWHLHGRKLRGDLAGDLRRAGFLVDSVVVYDVLALPPTPDAIAAIYGSRPVLLPLFSPQSATRAAQALAGATAPLILLSLSAAVDEAAIALSAHQRHIARRPDADGMLEIVIAAVNSGALS